MDLRVERGVVAVAIHDLLVVPRQLRGDLIDFTHSRLQLLLGILGHGF